MRENKQRTHVVSHIVQKAEGGEQSGALRLAGDGAKKKIPEAEASGNLLEVTTRFELVDEGFADPCLTTWPRHHIWSEYFHSIWSGRRGSNSLPPPWQGGALPDELRPHIRCICPCTLPLVFQAGPPQKFAKQSFVGKRRNFRVCCGGLTCKTARQTTDIPTKRPGSGSNRRPPA